MDGPAISFGPYRLLATRRLLLEGDKPVRLGGRAFDILTALVERAGEVVSKEELIARAWPATFVEEANLKIQVSALRRALGDGQGDNRYVATLVGRGYKFVAPICNEEPPPVSLSPTTARAAQHNLPFATTRMIGRDEIATTLVAQLSLQRLVTIVGPGGIGKTTVGLAVAEQMIGAYERGVWLVDLAPLRDPGVVPTAVATVLGLEIRNEEPLSGLVAALRDSSVLLLLDNCEHVIDSVAGVVAALLSRTSDVRILATSREPLGVQGERVHRLRPLDSPGPLPTLTATEAAAFPSVQLFVERATAIVEDFALTDANASLVGTICRRLDGLPLAIEFAAPRVEVLGVEGLAACLDDGFQLLGMRRRAPMPRQPTMQAVVEWSYGLLTADEQRFFRALGIFAGGFTIDAAAVVATDMASAGTDAIDRLADLVAKSLVVVDVSGTKPRFRLLETTRAHALEKLNTSSEHETIARRHAMNYRWLFARAEAEAPARMASEWLAEYVLEIDNLRAALNWAFGANGDVDIAVALASTSSSLWLEMSLLTECRGWMETALGRLGDIDAAQPHLEMVLRYTLGISLMFTQGFGGPARDALTRASELAQSVPDLDYTMRALTALNGFYRHLEEFDDAVAIARRAWLIGKEIADPIALSAGDRILGSTLTFLGEYAEAWTRATRIHRDFTPNMQRVHLLRYGFNHLISAHTTVAQVLWLRGLYDQSAKAARNVLAEAQDVGHALSFCFALTWGVCPISFRLGDMEAAKHSVALLKDHAFRYSLSGYHAASLGFEGYLAAQRDDTAAAEILLQDCLRGLRESRFEFLYTPFLSGLAEVLATAGRIEHSLAAADEALRRAERNKAFWWMPEALRIKGDVLLMSGEADPAMAAIHFHRSLNLSHAQGALSWELRAATSLARLLRDQGRLGDATACLQPIYDRFTEGFATADLIAAKQLLDDLGAAGRR